MVDQCGVHHVGQPLDNVDFNRLVETRGQEKSCRQLHSSPTNDEAQQQQQSWQM